MAAGRGTLRNIAVAAFVIVTAALILPAYLKNATTPTPTDHKSYVVGLIETRGRVFGLGGTFGRLPADTELQEIERFECLRAQDAQREFGWRGAYELLFDCAVVFRDTKTRRWATVIRLIYDGETPPEGYGWNIPAHIDKAELLLDRGVLPLR